MELRAQYCHRAGEDDSKVTLMILFRVLFVKTRMFSCDFSFLPVKYVQVLGSTCTAAGAGYALRELRNGIEVRVIAQFSPEKYGNDTLTVSQLCKVWNC